MGEAEAVADRQPPFFTVFTDADRRADHDGDDLRRSTAVVIPARTRVRLPSTVADGFRERPVQPGLAEPACFRDSFGFAQPDPDSDPDSQRLRGASQG